MAQPTVIRVRASVGGRVQQVGFRMFVACHRARLGLHGTVSNRDDGTVECVCEGDVDRVDALVALLHEGPPAARVARVDVMHEQPRGDLPPMRSAW